jgi:AcrR family transcriptional regulator
LTQAAPSIRNTNPTAATGVSQGRLPVRAGSTTPNAPRISSTPIARTTGTGVSRTHEWLQQALVALVQEKPFRDIQITEIADRANVSRPAFYLHFRSKEDLLLSRVDVVFEAFRAELARQVAAGNVDRQRFSIMLFEFGNATRTRSSW